MSERQDLVTVDDILYSGAYGPLRRAINHIIKFHYSRDGTTTEELLDMSLRKHFVERRLRAALDRLFNLPSDIETNDYIAQELLGSLDGVGRELYETALRWSQEGCKWRDRADKENYFWMSHAVRGIASDYYDYVQPEIDKLIDRVPLNRRLGYSSDI